MNSQTLTSIKTNTEDNLKSKDESLSSKLWFFLKIIAISTAVTILGVFSWPFFLAVLPGYFPVIAIIIFLGGYWYYFSGHGPPMKWKQFRVHVTRDKELNKQMVKDTTIITLFFVLTVQFSFIVTFRIIPFPADTITTAYNFDTLPVGEAWVYIIVSAFVAGITEEVGFRGYAQVPLEDKFGAKFAIIITSVFFMVIHLNQAWAPPIVFHIFGAGILFAVIAKVTGSLLPGIVAHSILDIFNFSYWWSNILGEYSREPISQTGLDGHFIISTIVFIFSLSLLVWYLKDRNLNN